MITEGPLAYLPGGELLDRGLRDVRRGVRSVPALLVAMAWPRLSALGMLERAEVEAVRVEGEDLEITAYRLLSEELGIEAHARLNALYDELDSGLSALERERRLRGA